MRTNLIDRRSFMRAAGIGFVATLSPRALAAASRTDAVYATAFKHHDGSYGAAILTEQGKLVHSVVLPDRGHDIAFDPVTKRSVIFARQPGTFAMVFDPEGKTEPQVIESIEGRHFFGHGVFTHDGILLYATENDFDNAAGMVGVYDARDGFRRIGEFPTYGVGPHELILLSDGKTLAVANGGIETHPDFGRAKLNLSTMRPSFVFIDRLTGDLLEKHELPPELHQLSIRHMDIGSDGAIWFGCQHEGPATERPLLVGKVERDKHFGLIDMPDKVVGGFRNYIGSVAANREAGTVAVSSPQGNSLAILDTRSGAVLSATGMDEVCGIAPDGEGFIATTGLGEIVMPDGNSITERNYVWDNHMLRIGTG